MDSINVQKNETKVRIYFTNKEITRIVFFSSYRVTCRTAEVFCKLSMECKAGDPSIARGCIKGSPTGVLGTEIPSSSSIVVGFSTDPYYSQGKKKSVIS